VLTRAGRLVLDEVADRIAHDYVVIPLATSIDTAEEFTPPRI
jgi:hypothetical protein